jgi:hypothetical protein
MKDGHDTQENVGEENDTQEPASDSTTIAEAAGNNASIAIARTPIPTMVTNTHLIEDFEVPVTRYFAVLRSTPIPATRIRQLKTYTTSKRSIPKHKTSFSERVDLLRLL